MLRARFFEALDRENGSISAAAHAVGVNRNTAYGWARQAGVHGRGKPGTGEHPGRAEYDRLRAGGARRRDAARQVGVHERTAGDWDRGIRKSNGARLHPDGRRVDYKTGVTTSVRRCGAVSGRCRGRPAPAISHGGRAGADRRPAPAGQSLRAIGRVLGRPASTVKREIDARSVEGVYRPHRAQRAWAASRARPKASKLAQPGPLRDYVVGKLQERWSPEQICHALVEEFADDEGMRVSPETIYQAVYVQARGGLRREVAAALRTGRTRRKPHRRPGPAHPAVRRPDGDDLRPATRGRGPGGARALGRRPDRRHPQRQSAIVTLVERSTRYVMLGHLPGGHTAEEVRDVLVALIATLPEHLRGSLTWDQGCEMAAHKQFTVATGHAGLLLRPALARGSAGRTRTPTACCASTSPKAPTCPSTPRPTSNTSPSNSTADHAKRSAGETPAERLRDLLTA